MKDALIITVLLALALALTACVSKPAAPRGPVDWPSIVARAAPEYRPGECGPELVWREDVAIYEKVEIEGTIVIRRKCAKPAEDSKE